MFLEKAIGENMARFFSVAFGRDFWASMNFLRSAAFLINSDSVYARLVLDMLLCLKFLLLSPIINLMLKLNPNMTDVVLSYLSFEDMLCLRLVSKDFRDKIVPLFTHNLTIANPNEDFKAMLQTKPDWVLSHYRRFCNLSTLRFSNLILNRPLLSVVFAQQQQLFQVLNEIIQANSHLECAKYIDLKFAETDLVHEFCKTITSSPHLKVLVLSNISPISNLVHALCEIEGTRKDFFRGIQELDISSNPFEGDIASLKDLLVLFPKAKKLNIAGIGLAEDVVEIIGDISKSTKTLSMALNGITADVCKGLSYVFPQKLERLELNDNWLGMGGVYNLKKWFTENGTQLKALNLENNKLFRDEHDTDYLAQLLSLTTNLEELWLGMNSMRDEDLAVLINPIMGIKGLKMLNINIGLLSKVSATILITMMAEMKELEHLNVFSNFLEDEGCGKIFENLHVCQSLRFLNLSGNKAKGNCLDKLLQFAEEQYDGSELKILMVGNPISPARRETFEKKLAEVRNTKAKFALSIKFKPHKNLPVTKPYQFW
eukprot:TRINITY_DN1425_c0_g1_i1.p1 TRINITY_DN1425_c0_g1~~TRINITY_DN1425_c0_g1_i1.p1  ORF type:complete len:543 (-),score=40.68 TRINITY_DN1425_c0_g1_i1:5058-6686(-)